MRAYQEAKNLYQQQGLPIPEEIEALSQSIQGTGKHPHREDIIKESQALFKMTSDMDRLRRSIIGTTFKASSLSWFVSYEFQTEIIERLAHALAHPFTIDETTIEYFSKRVEHYWKEHNTVAVKAASMLPFVLDDVQKLLPLLESPLLPSIRTQLVHIVAQATLLAGILHFDISAFDRSREYCDLACQAALEINESKMGALALARKSFAWSYDNDQYDKAFQCIEAAKQLVEKEPKQEIAPMWIAAIEAEIHAKRGDYHTCLRTLPVSQDVNSRSAEYSTWAHFDSFALMSYQGACFVQLASLSDVPEHIITDAQRALSQAISHMPTRHLRFPTLAFDLALTSCYRRDIEQARQYINTAYEAIQDRQSAVYVKRFDTLKQILKRSREKKMQELSEYVHSLQL
uniref:MalT-like TPR region domain-containing protein n=1 Tax=Thermosporothrix sp. COM3 TaxID=2490863 RepID=A0A455SY12_9CHLR|nr:hypothetical protein KTC_65330 [Thermosporothrix sp. COM3]